MLKDIKSNIFSNVVGNPTGSNVNEGVKIYHNNKNDGVIAFGGGSGLDVGKAIAFMSVTGSINLGICRILEIIGQKLMMKKLHQ